MMMSISARSAGNAQRALILAAGPCRLLSSTPPKVNGSVPQQVLRTANELLKSLRWKAANALTLSLSDDERQQLLSRMSHNNNDDASATTENQAAAAVPTTTNTKSIGEAVATARMEEAIKLEIKWEKEKEKIMEEAERAALARVEADLAIQKQKLELEKLQATSAAEPASSDKATPTAVETVAAVKEHAVEVVEDNAHPVLGHVVKELGTKRLHSISAETLQSIPVWEKQRTFRHDRAKSMATDKMKTLHLGMLGVITLYEDLEGRLFILDGQHRVGMMAYLMEKHPDLKLDDNLVEVYTQKPGDRPDHAQEIFLEINKAEPVKLIDMPGYATEMERKTITDGATRLKEQFPDMFKESQKCRPPHVNLDNLRDQLFGANITKKHDLKSGAALAKWILEQNKKLETKYAQEDLRSKVNPKVMEKADKFKFYLGLDPSWLY